MPGGIDAHTHSTCRSAGRRRSDDFETGTRAAAFGGTTSIVDFAIQAKGESAARRASTAGTRRREGKAAIDYGFHMIITDVNDQVAKEMDDARPRGRHLVQAVHGVPAASLMIDDGGIFRAMQRDRRDTARSICMHAENGDVIDVLVKQALAQGNTAPKYHALTRPPRCRGRGDAPGDRPGRDGRRAASTSCTFGRRGARRSRRGARPRPARLRRDLPAVPLPLVRRLYDEPGFEGAKYVMIPPMRAKGNAGGALARSPA